MLVFVYFNLHKKCWSVRDCATRKVIHHAKYVQIANAEFKVSLAGNARVRRENRKNVHAGVEGELVCLADSLIPILPLGVTRVSYNPYKNTTFVDNLGPVYKAQMVYMDASLQKAEVWYN